MKTITKHARVNRKAITCLYSAVFHSSHPLHANCYSLPTAKSTYAEGKEGRVELAYPRIHARALMCGAVIDSLDRVPRQSNDRVGHAPPTMRYNGGSTHYSWRINLAHGCQQRTPSVTQNVDISIVRFIQVRKEFHGENDRVKLIVLYCGMEDDIKLVRAASGALATLTYDSVVCHKVMTVSLS